MINTFEGIKNTQIVLTKKGDCSVYQTVETELTALKDDEVRIKVLRSGIAWADVMMRIGYYPGKPKFPFVQGYDLIGEIIEIGKNVSEKWLHKRVASLVQWGGYSKYINLPTANLIEVPSNIDLSKAACLLLNYVTAYQLLHRESNVKDDGVILVHGAAGGVGSALLQLARLKNIKVYGTASKAKHNILAENNAYAIDYKTENFEKIIRSKEPEGIDAFYDFNGGNTFDKSFNLLHNKGFGVVYNMMEANSTLDFMLYFTKFFFKNKFTSKQVKFYSIIKDYEKHFNFYKEDLQTLFTLLETEQINPIIAKEITLDEVPKTHCDFEKNKFVGKIIVIPNRDIMV